MGGIRPGGRAGGTGLRGPRIVEIDQRRAYLGVERGFIFFEDGGVAWKGITDVDTSEENFQIEKYYVDGKAIGHRHHKGNFHAEVTSYDDPFGDRHTDEVTGFSYRENYIMGNEQHYRLHVIHGASMRYISSVRETVNVEDPDATTYSWEVDSVDVVLRSREETDELKGSHLILDSSMLFAWSMRDIENILYTDGRIPSIDEMFDIFSEMNLLIIDHGDGTWSAVGHESMIGMLDASEFIITSPTVEFHEDDPRTFDIEDLIRDERWLQ